MSDKVNAAYHPYASAEEAAQARILDEVAAELEKPGMLWWGDDGAEVRVNPRHLTFIPLSEWLRTRLPR